MPGLVATPPLGGSWGTMSVALVELAPRMQRPSVERLSIELTNRCGKACAFCYNASAPAGETRWTVDTLTRLVADCAAHGTAAVSFGGGEPLEVPDLLFPALARLRGVLFRSLTSNGLLLDGAMIGRLVAAAPDKIHLSLHFPDHPREVARVVRQVGELSSAGLRSGVNLLVARSRLAAAAAARERLHAAGIGNDRIVFLPMRGRDTPTPAEVAMVAGGRFQSTTCLASCGPSPRFAAISWDHQLAHCSYTATRRPLPSLDFAGLEAALAGLGLSFCGGNDDGPAVRLAARRFV